MMSTSSSRGSAIFAVPPGVTPGTSWGQALFT